MNIKNIAISLTFLASAAGISEPAFAAKPRAHVPVAAKENVQSPQVKLLRDFLISKGRENFIVLDKRNATLILFNHGEEIFRTPALFGSASDEKINPYSTPVGEFPTRVERSANVAGTTITFLCPSRDTCLVIHATVGPDRARRYGHPKLSMASSGCINTQLSGYKPIEAFVSAYAAHGERIPLFVLPYNSKDLDQTRMAFNIPPQSVIDAENAAPKPQ